MMTVDVFMWACFAIAAALFVGVVALLLTERRPKPRVPPPPDPVAVLEAQKRFNEALAQARLGRVG